LVALDTEAEAVEDLSEAAVASKATEPVDKVMLEATSLDRTAAVELPAVAALSPLMLRRSARVRGQTVSLQHVKLMAAWESTSEAKYMFSFEGGLLLLPAKFITCLQISSYRRIWV
jgi:hypothetical protein